MIPRRDKQIYSFSYVLLFSFIVFLAHIYFLAIAPYDLYADEAQYWSWSKNLDWGYFSKPPVVAWLIAATTNICGDGSFCVKLASPILHFLTGLIVYGIGYRLFNKRTGFWSAISYATIPGITVSSYIISTDVPLLFFWSLSLYAFIRGLQEWHIKWWILLGIAGGLGMLSKYTMVLFFASAGLYFLVSKPNRVYLFSFKFWLSLVIAGAIYWPNFLWNKNNNFVSFLHTQDNADLKGIEFHFDKMFEFIGAQFGVLGPIFFALLLFYTFLRFSQLIKKDQYKLLFCFILPFLGLITTISLLSRAHANWAVPAYIGAIILVISNLTQNRNISLIKISLWIHIIFAVLFYQFHNISPLIESHINPKANPFKRIQGRAEFAKRLKEEIKLNDQAILLTTDRKTHATLLYYLRDENGNLPKIVKWNGDKDYDDHYDLTTDMNDHLGQNFLLVTKPYDMRATTKRFRIHHKSGFITIPIYENYALEYDVYYLTDFLGYE